MVDPGLLIASGAACGSLLGTAVAAASMVRQDRRAARAAGLDSLWRMIDLWDSPPMQSYRVAAAERLLRVPRVFDEHTETVLNFFELLGYLLRTGTLTEDDVWTNFAQWAVAWWYACEFDIKATRGLDSTVYEEYAALVECMRRYELERRPGVTLAQTVPSPDTWDDFLRREARVRALAVVAPGAGFRQVADS